MATLEELRAEYERRKTKTGQQYAPANQNMHAIEVLRDLRSKGQIRPGELDALDDLERGLEQNEATINNTVGLWRGAQRGGSAGLSDEMAGIKSYLFGDGFQAGRDASIAKDRVAQAADPEAFRTGEGLGAGASAVGLALASRGKSLAPTSMTGNVLLGGLGGAGFGALQGQSDYEMAGRPGGVREWLDAAVLPTAIGAGTGALAYPVARGVGAGVGAIMGGAKRAKTGFSRVPTNTIRRDLENTIDGGQDVRKYLLDLTPEATLADVPGNLRARGQGLAVTGGAGAQKLTRALEGRAAGSASRIKDDLNKYITQPNKAFQDRLQNAQARTSEYGPMYDAALESAGALEVRPVIKKLQQASRVAGPDTSAVLSKYLRDLEAKAPNGLISPEQLHWIRSDLSDALSAIDGPSKKNTMLTTALKDIDNILDTVPDYAAARTGYGNTFAMDDAVDFGQGALRGGRASALSPDEFAVKFNALSDAQKDAFRAGLRRDVAGLMGTSKNEPASAWGEFAKEWNEDKLRLVLGDADADKIIKRLRSENVFSGTRGDVLAGSQTEFRKQAAQGMGPFRDPETNRQPGALTRVKNAVIDDPINAAINSLVYGGKQSKRNLELGQMLSLQGQERDDLIRALIENADVRRIASEKSEPVKRLLEAIIYGGGGASSGAVQ